MAAVQRQELKCVGALPYSFNEYGELVVLLGQEDKSPEWSDSEKWSDFCGAPEKEDKNAEAGAAREWWQETMGIYGCEATYLKLIQKSGTKIQPAADVVTYLVRMPYEPVRVETYNNIYKHLTKCKVPHPIWKGASHLRDCPEGYGEKTTLRWVSYAQLMKELTDPTHVYRPSFAASMKSENMKTTIGVILALAA